MELRARRKESTRAQTGQGPEEQGLRPAAAPD
jgi:hypothetical protein